jgi:hypothetical protein
MSIRLSGSNRLCSVACRWLLVGVGALLAVTPVLAQPPPLRIMPLGDSITYGSNNSGNRWRLPLPALRDTHQCGVQRRLHRHADLEYASRPR